MTVGEMTKTHKSYPVNPLLAHPVYLSGYIERLGTGTLDMVDRCVAKGLKAPEFNFDDEGQVIIWRKIMKNLHKWRKMTHDVCL